MLRLKPFVLALCLAPLLAGCGIPGAVANGVKSVQHGLGIGDEPPPPPAQPQQPPPPPAHAGAEPPPPQPVQRSSVKVEELR